MDKRGRGQEADKVQEMKTSSCTKRRHDNEDTTNNSVLDIVVPLFVI